MTTAPTRSSASFAPPGDGGSGHSSAKLPTVGIETYHGDDVYIHHPNDFTQRHVTKVNTDWTPCELRDMPTPLEQGRPSGRVRRPPGGSEINPERWGDRYEVIFSNSALLEVTAKGATKGGMVLKLAQLLGIARKDLYCVGDNQNDIPMLEVSAIPFAPRQLRRRGKGLGRARIVKSRDEHCIADIISILDGMYPSVKARTQDGDSVLGPRFYLACQRSLSGLI